jgi:hypothetical protein
MTADGAGATAIRAVTGKGKPWIWRCPARCKAAAPTGEGREPDRPIIAGTRRKARRCAASPRREGA